MKAGEGQQQERYQGYDAFAWLYAHHWGSEFHTQAMGVLERLVLRLLPAEARVLDLCCGDGRVARALVKRGFRVVGVDGSEKMLGYARERAPEATFYAADARQFVLKERFDCVLSTFDSLNHVMTRRDLQQVFRRVRESLEPGGYFAFDLNREGAYTDFWANSSAIVEAAVVSVAQGRYEGGKGVATCDITQFLLRKGLWERSDYTLTQKHHAHEHVMADLGKAGFGAIASLDAGNDLGMRGDIGKFRTFYLARKPD